MSLPQKYKAAFFKEAGGPLVIEETDLKQPEKGQVLVKVQACGVCFSDHFAQDNLMGGGFPIVPGHEIIGKVAAVPESETQWKVGDRVGGGWHGGHDGTCNPCQKGWYQMCNNSVVNGVTRSGGYAEYVLLRTEVVVPIPADVDAAKYAPILCAGVTTFNSMRHMNIRPGGTVAIQGLGGLGHLAIQYAVKSGYRTIALSSSDKKEKFARDLGAHEYIDYSKGDVGEQLQKLGGADLIVTTAPNADVIPPLIGGLGILGKLLVLSVPGEIKLNTMSLLQYGSSIQSWPSGHARDSKDAVEFTALTGVDCMVETFPLDKAQDAYDAMKNGSVRFRSVITME